MGNKFGKFLWNRIESEEDIHIHRYCSKCEECILCVPNHKCIEDVYENNNEVESSGDEMDNYVVVNNNDIYYDEDTEDEKVEETVDKIINNEDENMEELKVDEEDVIDISKNWALLVGINYRGQEGELNGCINDIENMKKCLMNKFSMREENIVILTDKVGNEENELPTRFNIIREINDMVKRAENGELKQLWFHYSGHGSSLEDDSDDEIDGKDEGIVPLDWKINGLIRDDDLNDYLVDRMPIGVKTLIFMDCCHSGTMLDLSFEFNYNKNEPTLSSWRLDNNNDKIGGEFLMISGCKDNQLSTDGWMGGEYRGAMTNAFLKEMEGNDIWNPVSFMELLVGMVKKSEEYGQTPQLTSSRVFDLSMIKLNKDWF